MRFRIASIALMLALVASSACGPKVMKLSPEGKIAYFGEKFMSGVEAAQDQVIAMARSGVATRAQVTPAVEVFVKIGEAGKDLATALRVIDTSNVTGDKQSAGVRAHNAIIAIQKLLPMITVRIESDSLRLKVQAIVDSLNLGLTLLDILQRLAPLLPPPSTPTNGAVIFSSSAIGGFHVYA